MAQSNFSAKIQEISESKLKSKEAHLAALGDIKGKFTLLHSQVLVVTYVQPARTSGGIIIPQKSQDEDRFQGTIGLVVALGKGAFKDDNIAKFHGDKLELSDWVFARPGDGMEMFINQVPCRVFEDVAIKAIVTEPKMFW